MCCGCREEAVVGFREREGWRDVVVGVGTEALDHLCAAISCTGFMGTMSNHGLRWKVWLLHEWIFSLSRCT